MKLKQWFMTCALIGITATIFAQAIDASVKKSVNDLVSDVSSRITVGIGAFTVGATGSTSSLSDYLRDQVSLYASQNKMYQVMSDDEVNAFEGETNFSKTRTMDPLGKAGTAKKSKIQAMISGKFTQVGDNVEVYLWLIATSDGRKIDSEKFTIPAADLVKAKIAILPENVKTEAAFAEKEEILKPYDGEENPFELLIWTADADYVFHNGDDMSFQVFSEKDCYIKVYYLSVTGEMQVIFPVSSRDDNYLKAQTVKVLPPDDVTYRMAPPYGEESIMIVASTQPFDFLPEETTATKITRNVVSRGLKILTEKTSAKDAPLVSTSKFHYSVLP